MFVYKSFCPSGFKHPKSTLHNWRLVNVKNNKIISLKTNYDDNIFNVSNIYDIQLKNHNFVNGSKNVKIDKLPCFYIPNKYQYTHNNDYKEYIPKRSIFIEANQIPKMSRTKLYFVFGAVLFGLIYEIYEMISETKKFENDVGMACDEFLDNFEIGKDYVEILDSKNSENYQEAILTIKEHLENSNEKSLKISNHKVKIDLFLENGEISGTILMITKDCYHNISLKQSKYDGLVEVSKNNKKVRAIFKDGVLVEGTLKIGDVVQTYQNNKVLIFKM